MSPGIFLGKWERKSATALLSSVSFLVFLCLDFLDACFCVVYRFLDVFFEGEASPCYCQRNVVEGGDGNGMSRTLFGRRNVFRQMGFFRFPRKWDGLEKSGGGGGGGRRVNRWSDCGCDKCISWMKDDGDELKLHVVVEEPSRDASKYHNEDSDENVVFLHGFLSSSSFWTETVFRNLSKPAKRRCRLFAVDLLGFGESPKPANCLYTLRDHSEMIEKSVINPFELKDFHIVAHSMGCIVALALAAKYSKSVKSVTLVAPPYFPSSKEEASFMALERLAKKSLWPPLLFGSSFMSWYEHLGRCVCLLFCRNHRLWEKILKLLYRRREIPFMLRDLTRHTHHSAWHSMHNVICGGAKSMDGFLETLMNSRVKVCVIQGDRDPVVPLECSFNIKMMVPDSQITVIPNADHGSVIVGREKEFTQDYLEHIWT